MDITITDELLEYMNQKKKSVIAVEVMGSDRSDFEYVELYVHFISEKQVDYFIRKKHFRRYDVNNVIVLLPNYKLSYKDTLEFFLKKKWYGHAIGYTGVEL